MGVAAARLLLGRLAPGTANLTIPCSSERIVINLSFSPNGDALIPVSYTHLTLPTTPYV